MFKLNRIACSACAWAAIAMPAAMAADIPVYEPVPVPPPAVGGWYLRGDIGVSNQRVKDIFNAQINATSPGIASLIHQYAAFDGAAFFGGGVCFQFNSWIRADVTGEWRSRANFHGLDIVTITAAPPFNMQPDVYSASKSEAVVLANVYLDLGTWWCITPFVGAGVGGSRNTIHSFIDFSTNTVNFNGGSTAFAPEGHKWDFAWALYAGVAYKVTPGFTVELAYRYLNLGDGLTGNLVTFDGAQQVGPMHFRDITSHDLKLGVRWSFDAGPPAYPVPIMRKG